MNLARSGKQDGTNKNKDNPETLFDGREPRGNARGGNADLFVVFSVPSGEYAVFLGQPEAKNMLEP